MKGAGIACNADNYNPAACARSEKVFVKKVIENEKMRVHGKMSISDHKANTEICKFTNKMNWHPKSVQDKKVISQLFEKNFIYFFLLKISSVKNCFQRFFNQDLFCILSMFIYLFFFSFFSRKPRVFRYFFHATHRDICLSYSAL